jgi:hypothetical protein
MRGAVPDQCRTGRQVLYASRQKVDEYITDAFRGTFVPSHRATLASRA